MADNKPAVNHREVGYARAVERGYPLFDDNEVLQFPQSAYTYARMMREDAQITSVYRAVTLPIRRIKWQLDPNGADERVVALVAEDLRLRVRGEDPHKPESPRTGRVSWKKHLEQLLRALQFGHMFFEQVYEVGDDGLEHLVKLAPRWPGTLSKLEIGDDGGLEAIVQRRGRRTPQGTRKIDPIRIPVSQLVAYVFDDLGGSWEGTSILRPAYKHWYLRDELLQLELIVLDRNGMGVPVYTGSDITNDPEGDLERGQDIAQGLGSGEDSGAAVPAGAKLEIKGTTGQLVSPREAIKYHDNMIARSVLAHFLNLDGGGSYALASTQADLFVQELQGIAEWVADTANQHVVEDLVHVAFPDYRGTMPLISFDPIASKTELGAGDLSQLVANGVILPDRDLEEHVRQYYALPPKQYSEEELAQVLADRNANNSDSSSSSSSPATPSPDEGGGGTSNDTTNPASGGAN